MYTYRSDKGRKERKGRNSFSMLKKEKRSLKMNSICQLILYQSMICANGSVKTLASRVQKPHF